MCVYLAEALNTCAVYSDRFRSPGLIGFCAQVMHPALVVTRAAVLAAVLVQATAPSMVPVYCQAPRGGQSARTLPPAALRRRRSRSSAARSSGKATRKTRSRTLRTLCRIHRRTLASTWNRWRSRRRKTTKMRRRVVWIRRLLSKNVNKERHLKAQRKHFSAQGMALVPEITRNHCC